MAGKFTLPAGVEAKAWQFAAMCLRDGCPSAVLSVSFGDISHMSLFDGDGVQHFYTLVDGEMVEYREVDDE